MTSEAFEHEVDDYVLQTAHMHLPDGDHLASFIDFAAAVLAMVRESWPAQALAWHHALEARRQGTLSMAQWREVQSALSAYRIAMGEPYGMNEAHGAHAALSFLFALAIESPEASAHLCHPPELARLLDEFVCEFIEHFGRGREVVTALKRAFHVTDA